MFSLILILSSALFGFQAFAVPKNECESALLGQGEGWVVVATESFYKGAEVRMALTHPDHPKPVTGVFRSYEKAQELELPSPKIELVAVILNELLGLSFDLQNVVEFTHQNQRGTLQFETLTHIKDERFTNKYREGVNNLSLYDFVLGLFSRSKNSILFHQGRVLSLNHSSALTPLTENSKTTVRQSGRLKTAWRYASSDFKERLMLLEKDAVREEFEGLLSETEIEQMWERVVFIKTRAPSRSPYFKSE